MKKFIYSLIIIFTMIFMFGCSNIKSPTNPSSGNNPTPNKPNENSSNSQNPNYTIKDFYPFDNNIKLTFEGTGMEFASFTQYVDFIKENKMQIRKNNGGTETVTVLENKDGELKIIFSKSECYFRENFLTKPQNQSIVLLKEPLVKGTSWTLSDGSKRQIANVDVSVATPAGTFKCIEVTTENSDSKVTDYYGLNRGLVKSVFKSNDMEVTSILCKVEENSPLTQNIRLFYPNIEDSKIYFIDKTASFNSNDITKLFFEKEFKATPSDAVGKVLGSNVKINSLYLNDDGMVYVDFSSNLVKEMNAGSGYESMLLQSITNTLGNYYSVDKVYITIEGNPYSSGHIAMKKGEFFKVKTNEALKLKEK